MRDALLNIDRSGSRWNRRAWIRLGGLGLLGARQTSANVSRAMGDDFGSARRCILLFLTGGPPQLDTFDLKPDAPSDIRGELKAIPTNVPGVRVGELCPLLARRADKYRIVRSVTHPDSTHTSAGYTMLTGAYHPRSGAKNAGEVGPTANDHPHIGSVYSMARPAIAGRPTFTALPETIKDAAVNEFPGQGAGFLGKAFDPFLIEADSGRTRFLPPPNELPAGVDPPRLADRRELLRRAGGVDSGDDLHALLQDRAFDLIGSLSVKRAFDLEREPPRVRDAYGAHLFGKGCLLARRLIEADVPFVTVYWHYEGPDDSPVWDTHENNFRHLRERLLPPSDRAIAALLEDLANRGLLDETLVICMGEFGRSPRINKQAGRDHWPHVQSILLAGPRLQGGVYGASDRIAAYPAHSAVSPPDLVATFFHLLGIPPDLEVRARDGRPLRACSGTPLKALLS